jgi:hypothetical protein
MNTRAVPSVITLAVLLSTAFACSSQPTAPSALDSPQPVAAAIAPPASTSQNGGASPSRFGDRTPGVVYVTSQGLFYDTFVVKDPLPFEGRFQLLTAGETEFGPGQPGYLGGRWWEDLNEDGIQDAGDHYFLCPLLPPGRETREP